MSSFITTAKCILYEFFNGILDSLRGIHKIFSYDKLHTSKKKLPEESQRGSLSHRRSQAKQINANLEGKNKILGRVGCCCFLNGFIYLFSLFSFYYFLLPILLFILELILNDGVAQKLWSFAQPVIILIFEVMWVLPVFLISRIINTIWFQDIANSAYRQRQGRPQIFSSISRLIADTLISCVIQFLFLIQATLVRYLPLNFLALFLHIFHMCLLNSLYSFEYRWCNMAWPLDKRLHFLEKNWPYFIGFGLPLSVITAVPSSVTISGCIWAILFPVFIISANEAVPIPNNSGFSINIFAGVVWLSNQFAHVIFKAPAQNVSATLSFR